MAVRPNTKLFFAETLANPGSDVLDIRAVADLVHEVGLPLIVDNTVPTPYLLRPIEHGADVVVHSATKYLGGHGTTIAGVLVDAGTFDFGAYPERFPGFSEPDPSYHGTELHSQLVNIGDVRSLIVHPASTTHSQLEPKEQLASGVTPGLVRLAVGLEGIEDLKADLEAGFRAAKAAL